MKKAFLSGLGVMGKRHLLGLLQGGFEVTAVDPRRSSYESAVEAIEKSGLRKEPLHWVDQIPAGEYDVAIFAETAPYRLQNLARFLENGAAEKILLEKPLSSDPEDIRAYEALLEAKRVAPSNVTVNLSRRTWPLFVELKTLCDSSSEVMMTVNGGAAGFGSNGIHFLDLFLFLGGSSRCKVAHAQISKTPVASGRGSEFSDFGGSFWIENERCSFFCSLSPASSAPPMFALRGDHFVASLDELDLRYRIEARNPESRKPNYLCGHDYQISREGIMTLMPFDKVTEQWAAGTLILPDFQEGVTAHRILFAILEAAGCPPPYRFT